MRMYVAYVYTTFKSGEKESNKMDMRENYQTKKAHGRQLRYCTVSQVLTVGGGGVTNATPTPSGIVLYVEVFPSTFCLEFPLLIDDLFVFLPGSGDVNSDSWCGLPSGLFAFLLGDVLSTDTLPPELLPFRKALRKLLLRMEN